MIPKLNTTRTGRTHTQLYFIVAVANILIVAVNPIIKLLLTQDYSYTYKLKLKGSYILGKIVCTLYMPNGKKNSANLPS